MKRGMGMFLAALAMVVVPFAMADGGEKAGKGECPIAKAAAAAKAKLTAFHGKQAAQGECAKAGKAKTVKLAKLENAKGECAKDGKAKTVKLAKLENAKGACCKDSKAKTVKLAKLEIAKGACCEDGKAKTVKLTKLASAPCAKGAAGCDGKAKGVKLASLLYRVGDFQTACETTAKSVAAKKNAKVSYVLGDKSFCDRGQAVTALTAALEKQAAELATVRFAVGSDCVTCPNAAKTLAAKSKAPVKYRVAGLTLECEVKAKRVATRVQAAVKTVALHYKVDGKKFTCSIAAGEAAKTCGKTLKFVVGKQTTECSVEAKLLAAQAKVKAILAAAEETPAADDAGE